MDMKVSFLGFDVTVSKELEMNSISEQFHKFRKIHWINRYPLTYKNYFF